MNIKLQNNITRLWQRIKKNLYNVLFKKLHLDKDYFQKNENEGIISWSWVLVAIDYLLGFDFRHQIMSEIEACWCALWLAVVVTKGITAV